MLQSHRTCSSPPLRNEGVMLHATPASSESRCCKSLCDTYGSLEAVSVTFSHSVTGHHRKVSDSPHRANSVWTPSGVPGPLVFSLSYSPSISWRERTGGRRILPPPAARAHAAGAGTGHSVSRIERPRGDSRDCTTSARPGQLPSSPTRSRSGTAHAVPTIDGLRPHPDSCPVGVGKGLLHVRPRCRVATDRPRRAATTARSCPPGTPRPAPGRAGVVAAGRSRGVVCWCLGRRACRSAVRLDSP